VKKSIAMLLLILLLMGCAAEESVENRSESAVDTQVTEPARKEEPEPEPEPEPPEPVVSTLAVCGDVMSHMPLTNDVYDPASQSYDYTRVLAGAQPYVSGADYAVANFETTMAGGPNYSGFPFFNSPDGLARSVKDAGFDLMLTANNHCLDKHFSGLTRTLDVMDEMGLAHVGTSRTQEEQDNGIYVADVGRISVAFLGFTYGTNGLPLPKDAPFAVNIFNTDYMTTLSTPDWDMLAAELDQAKALQADLIAVMIHWGVEYQTAANSYQQEMAEFLLKNGADMILGGHSHVPQPAGMQTVTLDDGTEHTGFVSYSLGNFISTQNDPLTDTTAILTLELTKDMVTGETAVTDWQYQPMLMLDREVYPQRYELLDVHKELASGELTDAMRSKLQKALEDCHAILGEANDAGSNVQ